MRISKLKTGIVVGLFFALFHLLWSVLVVTGAAQVVFDWIYKMHFLNNPFTIQPFDWLIAVQLVLMTFVVGFVVGWVFALLHNMLHKK
jgi:xanthosine utilization system XapX-like protein